MFTDGTINDIVVTSLKRFSDQRGWLIEIFRNDEVPEVYHPVMAYISETKPGVTRGPHEHVEQSDLFGFIGPSNFKLYLWDNRESSSTYRYRQVLVVGADNPATVIIPPGVVHAYKNVGETDGWVINCANQLYAGKGKSEPVDEIRHEADADSPFVLD